MSVFVCARKSVLILLTASLVLTIVRQIFDFIGRLWLPIAVNFMHMLFLIFGYFGILQYRPAFIIASAFWLPLCLTWNVFLCCYYLSLKPLDRNRPLLSLGMRLSKSFWVENMPYCRSYYDHVRAEWMLPRDCALPYWWVEIGQSIIHFLIAFLIFDLMLVCLCTFPQRRKSRHSKTHLQGNGTVAVPNETMQYRRGSAVSAVPNGRVIAPLPQRPQDITQESGYLNTSYSTENNDENAYHQVQAPTAPIGYQRRSSKKKTRRQLEAEAAYFAAQQEQEQERYEVSFMDRGNRRVQSHTSYPQQHHQIPDDVGRPRSTSPFHQQASNYRRQRPQSAYDMMSEQQRNSPQFQVAPLHNFAISPQKRQASLNSLHASRPPPHTAMLPQTQRQYANCNNAKDAVDRRLSVTEPRGIRNSNDSMINHRQQNNIRAPQHNIHSLAPTTLISFDPKSNTLIRYHERPETDHSITSMSNTNAAPLLLRQQQHQSNGRIAVPPPCDSPPSSWDSGVGSYGGVRASLNSNMSRRPPPPAYEHVQNMRQARAGLQQQSPVNEDATVISKHSLLV